MLTKGDGNGIHQHLRTGEHFMRKMTMMLVIGIALAGADQAFAFNKSIKAVMPTPTGSHYARPCWRNGGNWAPATNRVEARRGRASIEQARNRRTGL